MSVKHCQQITMTILSMKDELPAIISFSLSIQMPFFNHLFLCEISIKCELWNSIDIYCVC